MTNADLTGAATATSSAVLDEQHLVALRHWMYDNARPLIADEATYAQLDAWSELPEPVRDWVNTLYR